MPIKDFNWKRLFNWSKHASMDRYMLAVKKGLVRSDNFSEDQNQLTDFDLYKKKILVAILRPFVLTILVLESRSGVNRPPRATTPSQNALRRSIFNLVVSFIYIIPTGLPSSIPTKHPWGPKSMTRRQSASN